MKTIIICFVLVIFAFFLGNCQDNSTANNDQSGENILSYFENKEVQIREFIAKTPSRKSRSIFIWNSANFKTFKKNILLQKKKIESLELKAKTYQTKKESANSNDTATGRKLDNRKMFEEISEEELKNISLARVCTKSFFSLLPSNFCLKKSEIGTTDVQCASDDIFFRSYCWKSCVNGYYFENGLCLEKCVNGYTDFLGLLCKKSTFEWYFKKSYGPDVYNFYDSRAQCPYGKNKYFIDSQILCFTDCSLINFFNFGPKICAKSREACNFKSSDFIADKLLDEAPIFDENINFSQNELINSISGFFANSVEISQNLDIYSLNTVLSNIRRWLVGESNQVSFIDDLVSKAKDLFYEEENFFYFEENEINDICVTIKDMFYSRLNNQIEVVKVWKDLNISDLGKILKSCSSRIDSQCQKTLFENYKNWDPTLPIILSSLFQTDEC